MTVYENLTIDIANETSLTPEQATEIVEFLSTEAALDIPLLEQTYEQTLDGISNEDYVKPASNVVNLRHVL